MLRNSKWLLILLFSLLSVSVEAQTVSPLGCTITGPSINCGGTILTPGTGTVTSVSVTTANGVSGSVANPTTTPAISLTLGAITPTSVAIGGATLGGNALAVTGTALFNSQVTNALGTITTSQPFTLTQTWNASGVTFNALLVNVTSSASAAGSLLQDWQVASSSKASISKLGGFHSGIGYYDASESYGLDVSAGTSTRIFAGGAGYTFTSTLFTSSRPVVITAGTLADGAQAFSLTATQPASPSGTQKAITLTVTGAGSATQENSAWALTLAAGYTGSKIATAARIVNLTATSGLGAFIGLADNFPSTGAALVVDNGALAVDILRLNDNGTAVFTVADGGAVTAGSASITSSSVAIDSTIISTAGASALVVASNASINNNISQIVYGANISGAGSLFFKTRAVTTAPTTIVASGDRIFEFGGYGADGSAYRSAGSLRLVVDGTPGGSDMPGRFEFLTTPDGSATSVLALTINNAGSIIGASTTDSTTTTSGALQVAGGAAIRKRVFIDGITTSSGLQTAVLCQSSGGEMIADSVACLASASRFKDVRGPMLDGALAKIIKLPIDRWAYKAEGKFTSDDWTRERIGPLADDVAAMDPRLAGYDSDGNVRTYSTEQLLAFTIKALQELKADNDNLRDEMRRIAR